MPATAGINEKRLFFLVGFAEGIGAAGAVSAVVDFDLLSGALVIGGVIVAVGYLAINSGINRIIIHGFNTPFRKVV